MRSTWPRERSELSGLDWLRSLFASYYARAEVVLPEDYAAREWAFQPLGSSTYIRHLSFKTEAELRRYLVRNPPAHAYYSSARFLFPEVPYMEQKVWLGSDLIFDIDADHLPGCENPKTRWACSSCGRSFEVEGRGKSIACPACGSRELIDLSEVSPECLKLAARETAKLLRVLENDFGVDDVHVYFSGNRGFHVHVTSKELLELNGDERRELVDYLKGVGLELREVLELGGEAKRPRSSAVAPSPRDAGWRGRLGRVIYDELGLSDDKVLTFGELKGRDLEELIPKASVHVDEKVTIDVHRLVRLPGSLNGKTGMPVVEVRPRELEAFSLTCSLSPFDGTAAVALSVDLDVEVFDVEIHGERGELVELPLCAAVFLALRGAVERVVA
ncbi:MAG: DNA primase small subunit domain-containing protein [Fervidicoccaceae archaeon]